MTIHSGLCRGCYGGGGFNCDAALQVPTTQCPTCNVKNARYIDKQHQPNYDNQGQIFHEKNGAKLERYELLEMLKKIKNKSLIGAE